MPRSARKKTDSGTYHVIVRGNGKMALFEEDADNLFFLDKLRKYREECGIMCLAYVLMDNHVHLLLKDPNDVIEHFMKKLCVSYAQHFNLKYARSGHVFQDRFKSENVDTDEYLLTVYRYILKNPEKAGIGPYDSYRWSSWKEYDDRENYPDLNILREMIGSTARFRNFMKDGDGDFCMEFGSRGIDDRTAGQMIAVLAKVDDPHAIAEMSKDQRNMVLTELKRSGFTVRQLERLTGISRGIVQRAKSE